MHDNRLALANIPCVTGRPHRQMRVFKLKQGSAGPGVESLDAGRVADAVARPNLQPGRNIGPVVKDGQHLVAVANHAARPHD